MTREIELKILPKYINDEVHIKGLIADKLGQNEINNFTYKIIKRSIDARGIPMYLLKILVALKESILEPTNILSHYKKVDNTKKIIIIGAGPAGYFAALQCIEMGLKPIVLDRGKNVQARRRDLKAIQQDGVVNPHSNYCFGEGGAGTYSDGKLYTRSHKRGSIEKVLQILVAHGANPDILIDAHPHIGSNKLPNIIANIRATIEANGGEVHFDTYVTDFVIDNHIMKAAVDEQGRFYEGDAFILATGHSARDIFYLLHKKGVLIEPKPFALGVRIEHAQQYIDSMQYKQNPREENLPAASYKTVSQIQGKGVFSFCMCPGGLVVPAATSPGEIVVNGMSLSRRDSAFANSGFVTSIELDELEKYGYKGVFGALDFQAKVERDMFALGDGSQKAPAQRVDDFVNGKISSSLYDTSYIPGLLSAPLHDALPSFVATRLREAIKDINKKMKGYLSHDANVIGTESRTSSPVKIPRNKDSYMHPQISALFPCGEGAGYAGGILSAAMDGQNVVIGVKKYLG
jgi:uncharacterized protein